MEQNTIKEFKLKNKLIFALAIAALLILGVFISMKYFMPEPHIVKADIKRVFNEFVYTKELKNKREEIVNARKAILDSLEIEARLLSREVESSKDENLLKRFKLKLEYYTAQKKNFEEDNAALTSDYDSKILTQLDQYLKEFGESHGYDIILGTGEAQTVVYCKTEYDITDAVIKYVNNKYKGEAKQ